MHHKLYVTVVIQSVNPDFLEELSFGSYIKIHHLSDTVLFLQNELNNRGVHIFSSILIERIRVTMGRMEKNIDIYYSTLLYIF